MTPQKRGREQIERKHNVFLMIATHRKVRWYHDVRDVCFSDFFCSETFDGNNLSWRGGGAQRGVGL